MPTSQLQLQKQSLERRIVWMGLAAALPAVVFSLYLLWTSDFTPKVEWTFTVLIVSFWFGFTSALRERVMRSLQTISNLLAALREGDYSIRARGARGSDSLGEIMIEVNTLGETLREQRLGALEATTLLRTVMAEIEIAVFAFDGQQRLRLVNRAGERLLGQPAERLIGRKASDLALADFLEGDTSRAIPMVFPGGGGRWGIKRGSFRQGGLPHQLLVLTDLTRPLRQEELRAWQRLVRVLGHELNNSLAPIKSLAGSLASLLGRDPLPDDWREDMRRGLGVIAQRADALARFTQAYARLAKLPPPQFQPVAVGELVRRVAELESRLHIRLVVGPEITIQADPDQLEHVLINLVRNAVDAVEETGGSVELGWRRDGTHLEIYIEDEGPGISNPTNLFVPFFTTKPAGSGIGLVLSRQIAEAHGGNLTVENRATRRGCRARLELPL